ncbi:trypsin domain-containing protein [Phthorimaea operculella]|nr:trypsin domain-containing protein [Phthorimaea operculella]
MNTALILLLGAAAVAALPTNGPGRITGGEIAAIGTYPYSVALLLGRTGSSHSQWCAGTIINNLAVLTAAHCFMHDPQYPQPFQWRSRVGSATANSGGTLFNTEQIILHDGFNRITFDMDFAIVRVVGTFNLNLANVKAAVLAQPSYQLPDDAPVFSLGWGHTCAQWCSSSENLRRVQISTVNINSCRYIYQQLGRQITDHMICAGDLNEGGRGACQGDSGGPLVHNGTVVGVISWSHECGNARYPGVSARIPVVSNWIAANTRPR